MSLLVEYVQPLTNWLQQNPHWSLFITFLISLTESLAIIGSIVPGSVTMTAIGILAGSGIMRVDLTLLAAILGAVAGDSISYTLGYIYSDRLADIWPFNKYPQWLKYGKDFFALHGGKSVLFGRFIGPLRSIIPVIAGILHMKQWRFLIANVLSAIGWALLYVMPGVVIGAAGHELSAESATRLFVLILILLAGIWIISLMIKWLVSKLNSFVKLHLHAQWSRFLNRKTTFGILCKALTPKGEVNHDITASLAVQAMLSFAFFVILFALELQGQWITALNTPIYLFLQSVHSFVLEAFFIFCTQLTSTLTILTLFIICCIWFIYDKNFKAILYLSGLLICSTLISLLLNQCINSPRPTGLLIVMSGSSFPENHLLVASAFYGFLLFYINHIYSLFTNTLRAFVLTILGLSGLSAVYLGDYWLTDVLAAYFAGATIGLIFCLIYRKTNLTSIKVTNAAPMAFSLFLGMICATSLSAYLNFHTLSSNHAPYHKEFALSESIWWNQKKPILPLYRLNRIGKRISLLNIEYLGDLDLLEEYLVQNGWESRTESFFSNLLTWINNQSNSVKLPLLTQLYENKAPSLFMIYTDTQTNLSLELRIWESNYYLSELNRPLWIGSIHPSAPPNNKLITDPGYTPNLIDPLTYLLPAKNHFAIKKIAVPDTMVKTTTFPTQPYIILLKKKK
jgi:membrane protein DedA with SNARE-associated domain/membrane-associated phospholipid phosphatase